jgi:hypothetical protein
MPSTTIKLLHSIPADRIEKITDYIDYWDLIKVTKKVEPGFLYNLIKNGDPLPATFESSRQREARKLAEERRERLHLAKQSLEVAYEEYSRAAVDRFIADEFPQDEFTRRVEAKKRELGSQFSFWDKVSKPEFLESMANGAVRSEIAKQVSLLSFEDFCRREGPRILADYNIDLAELGLVPIPPSVEQ